MECSINMKCSIDMNMQHGQCMQCGHGHAAWTWTCSMDMDWTCSMDMDTQHRFGHAAWTWTVAMHGFMDAVCRNADKKLSPALLVFR